MGSSNALIDASQTPLPTIQAAALMCDALVVLGALCDR